MKQKGVTLIELLIVIVIMGIVAAFAVVEVVQIISNTRISVDSYNLAVLNAVTQDYGEDISSGATDIFTGIATDTERMSSLVEDGYLDGTIRVQQSGASFEWDVSNQVWNLIGGETNSNYSGTGTSFDFTSDTLQDMLDGGSIIYEGGSDWSTDSGVLTNETGETRIYIPVSQLEYTITSNVALYDGSNGGYGVLFDTTLQSNSDSRDTGYVLQFDRYYEMAIVRPRTNGHEGDYVWDNTESGYYLPDEDTAAGELWWIQSHELKIVVVSSSETKRTATFYIDGDLMGSYTYTNNIEEKQIYTGFRGWGSGGTEFYSLSVD